MLLRVLEIPNPSPPVLNMKPVGGNRVFNFTVCSLCLVYNVMLLVLKKVVTS